MLNTSLISRAETEHFQVKPQKIDIKRAVSEQRKVQFVHYRDGDLYYKTEFGELFAVPISDVGNATFLAEDKAILFMRYMRKHNNQF